MYTDTNNVFAPSRVNNSYVLCPYFIGGIHSQAEQSDIRCGVKSGPVSKKLGHL